MQSDSSGLLESLAVTLFCIVALAAIHRNDSDAPVCQAERVAIGLQRAATPVHPVDTGIEAEIKDMLRHDSEHGTKNHRARALLREAWRAAIIRRTDAHRVSTGVSPIRL
jgi:hypothetical protein